MFWNTIHESDSYFVVDKLESMKSSELFVAVCLIGVPPFAPIIIFQLITSC